MADEGREMGAPSAEDASRVDDAKAKMEQQKREEEERLEREQRELAEQQEKENASSDKKKAKAESKEVDEEKTDSKAESEKEATKETDGAKEAVATGGYIPSFDPYKVESKVEPEEAKSLVEPEKETAVDYEPVVPSTNNMDNSRKVNLNKVKNDNNRTRVQKFVAQVCGISDNKQMTRLNTLGSILWCGAKLGVACAVFGPLVGGWLVAHYNNHDYFAKKEQGAFDFINTMMFDKVILGPEGKFDRMGPHHHHHGGPERGR